MAALISLLQAVTDLLSSNPFVVIIALDFSKVFDSVRHTTLLNTITQINIRDVMYICLVNFLRSYALNEI